MLWFLLDDPQLSAAAKSLIEDPANEIFVSPASYWEIAIKIGLGKYSLTEPLDVFLDREIPANDFEILHILPRHAAQLTILPRHHADPFDRLIICQAIVEEIPVVTADSQFRAYPVTCLW